MSTEERLSPAFEWTTPVATHDISAQSIMKLSVLMKILQETGELHLARDGMHYERLRDDGVVFVMTRTCIRIVNPPKHRDILTVKSWERGTAGAQFLRDFKLYCGEELLVEATGATVTVDPEEHKILKPERFLSYGVQMCPEHAVFEKLDKIRLPKDMQYAGQRAIRFSDLDFNGHVNNAVYGDILCDFIADELADNRIYEVQINYISECLATDTLEIFTSKEGGFTYICGRHARGVSFECRVALCPLKKT